MWENAGGIDPYHRSTNVFETLDPLFVRKNCWKNSAISRITDPRVPDAIFSQVESRNRQTVGTSENISSTVPVCCHVFHMGSRPARLTDLRVRSV